MQAGTHSVPERWVRWLVLLACVWLCLPHTDAVAQATAPRIAYVDMQRLIDNAPQMAEARERLAREFAVRDNLLKADEARLAELQSRLDVERGAALTPGERSRLQQEADALRRLIERTRGQLAEELNARSREEVDRTWPVINEAVAEYARERGLDLVVGSPVLFVSGRLDITDQVLVYLRERDESAP